MGDLATGAGTVVPAGATVEDVAAPEVTPVCGNNVCETGEVCGADDAACCIADCPNRYIECPTDEGNNQACSARGECDYTTGVCTCMLGHTGDECATCASGYLYSKTGTEILCQTAVILSQAEAPPPVVNQTAPPCIGVCQLSGGAIALIAFLALIAFISVVILLKIALAPDEDEQAVFKNAKAGGIPIQSAAEYNANASQTAAVSVPVGGGFVGVQPQTQDASQSFRAQKAGRSGLTPGGSFAASMHARSSRAPALAPVPAAAPVTGTV